MTHTEIDQDAMDRRINMTPTYRFTEAEWKRFEELWVDEYAQGLVAECGKTPAYAAQVAEMQYEQYLNQEGYTGRDERISVMQERSNRQRGFNVDESLPTPANFQQVFHDYIQEDK